MSLFGNPNEGIFGDAFDYDHNGELDAMEQATEMATLDWLLSGDGDDLYETDVEDIDDGSSDNLYGFDEEETDEDDEGILDWL